MRCVLMHVINQSVWITEKKKALVFCFSVIAILKTFFYTKQKLTIIHIKIING